MATLVHLAPASAASKIRRSGIRRHRTRLGFSGVYATPVTRSYFATHQWLRELKRAGHSRIVAVYFKIPDTEIVEVGHYGRAHTAMTAAEAVALVSGIPDPLGFEVVVPRRIESGEVTRIREISQVVGWRYWPGAHGRAPCPCDFCSAGTYGAAKIRRRSQD